MTKSDLVTHLSERTDLPQRDIVLVLDALAETIHAAAARGDDAIVPGVCRIKVAERPPRRARNPKTGEPIQVPARRVARFRPHARLARAID